VRVRVVLYLRTCATDLFRGQVLVTR